MQKSWKRFAMVMTACGIASSCYATAPGFYMGLKAGPATNSGSTQNVQVEDSAATVPANPRSNQFGSEFFMGYKISPYASVEGGVDYFSSINYDTKGVDACSSVRTNVYDLNIGAKGMLPLGTSFDVFAKAAAAGAYVKSSGALNPSGTTQCGDAKNEFKFKPAVSVGASYSVNQNWELEASWNRLMVGGIVGNMDMYALGFSYHFVDKFCGQFLCDD